MDYHTLIEVADTFVGEQVLVRAYRPEDAEALFAALNTSREHLYPWFPFFHESHYELAETRDMLVRWQAQWLLRENFFMGIFQKTSGQFLGSVGCEARDWKSRSFEIGYWLCQEAQGHGYVTEAVRLITDYLFTHLAAQRVEIRCDARNQRSGRAETRFSARRLPAKCGPGSRWRARNHTGLCSHSIKSSLAIIETGIPKIAISIQECSALAGGRPWLARPGLAR